MLKNNGIYTLDITGYTSDGEGVGRIDGQVVFVPRTIAGERCRVRIVNIGKTAAHGVREAGSLLSARRHAACSRVLPMKTEPFMRHRMIREFSYIPGIASRQWMR